MQEQGRCKCGYTVWSGGKPGWQQLVICPDCYRDCSTGPGLRRAPITAGRLRKQYRHYPVHRLPDIALNALLPGHPWHREWLRNFVRVWLRAPWKLERERAYAEEVTRLRARGNTAAPG